MEAAGTLELVAELAVAFAGFSGIVGVYRARAGESGDPRADLRLLVEYSVFLLALSLFPLFLWHAGLTEASSWRAASLGAALYNAGYYWYRYRTIMLAASEQGLTRAMQFYIACDWLLSALLIANASGVIPFNPIVVYLVSLAFQLTGTTTTFVRFIAPLWRPTENTQ